MCNYFSFSTGYYEIGRPFIRSITAPEKYPAWSGVRIADHDSQPCPQQDAFGIDRTFFGSEDCLYLNVYTPQKRQPNATLSVMVFFHGGGFLYGGSSSQIYGPQRLLDNNIVLVTTNYRLGALGFLTTGTADSPGNNGLKDQVMALKWVKDNIAAFGGLPEDVTIFGHSAGAASVAYHLVSPLSKGLFSKAILQSGNSFDPWAIINTETAIDRARRVGEILNCTENDGYDRFPEMIKCLRDKSAENITLTTEEFYIVDGEPINVFGPVLEHSNINGVFLTENPDQIKNSYGTNVPVMIGVTSGEGIFKSAPILYGYRDEFQENFREILPSLLVYDELPLSIQDAVTEKIDDFYFKKDHKWSRRRHQNLTNLFSDRLFYYGMDKFLRNRLATTKNSSTYVYFFNHKGPKSLSQLYGGGLSYYGVAHGDELPFLFPLVQDHLHGSKYDKKMRWAMPKMWTDFAKTGNPTPSLSSIKQQWMPASKFPLNYARIGAEDYKNSHHQTNENDKIKKTENSQANDSVKLTENMTQQGIQKSGTKKHRSIRNTVSILEKTPNLRESKKHRKHKKKEKKAKRKEIVTNEIGLAEERMKFWRNLEQFMATAKSRGEEAQTESQIKEDIQKGA